MNAFFCIFRILKVLMQRKRLQHFDHLVATTKKEGFDWELDWSNEALIYGWKCVRNSKQININSTSCSFRTVRFLLQRSIIKILYSNGPLSKGKVHQDIDDRIKIVFQENYEVEQVDKPKVLSHFQEIRTIKMLMQGSEWKLLRIESSFTTMK